MERDDEIGVIFEIDEAGAATGIIHPFCSESCLDAGFYSVVEIALERGFGVVKGETTDLDSETHCEHCSNPIYDSDPQDISTDEDKDRRRGLYGPEYDGELF